jgi:hypothetical protein
MDLLSLVATLSLDNKKFRDGMNESKGLASKIGGGIQKALGAAAKVTAAGVAAGAAGMVSLTKKAVDSFAEYEQLAGGVETLFKGSADKVKKYADNAYKTAGMSANDYMQTVTSFSASLLQSLGGDTEKAAEAADRAVIDMSDKMLVRVKRIEPYQGCRTKRSQEMAA